MDSAGSHDAEDTKVIDSTIITADSAAELSTKATHATETEHALGFWRAVHLYPQAIGWSVFFSLGIIMCAFDPQLMGQLYAVPAFQRDFGYEVDVCAILHYQPSILTSQGDYVVPASWQTGLSMGSPLGQVVGALAAGYPMEWYGRKKVGPLPIYPYSLLITVLLDLWSLRHWNSRLHLHPILRSVSQSAYHWRTRRGSDSWLVCRHCSRICL